LDDKKEMYLKSLCMSFLLIRLSCNRKYKVIFIQFKLAVDESDGIR
jgi:hypothetical protein